MSTHGFCAGTLVHTDQGLISIEQIKVGDRVLSKSEDDPNGELSYQRVTETHRFEDKSLRLIRFIKHNSQSSEDINGIIATPNHPFWVDNKGWVRSDHLRVGDIVRLEKDTIIEADNGPLLKTDKDKNAWVPHFPEIFSNYEDGFLIDLSNDKINSDLSNILVTIKRNNVTEKFRYGSDEENAYVDTVYNITVENTHTYFVGENGIWVHQ